MTHPSADYLSSSVPYNYDQPLPPLARTNAVTQVPPAKKITFYKSGDPQFGGVKMAINQRSFKSFNALMDDLSHRVPLPFGVRTITTPRGIHCISTLDQLEDGGCYLCSDKKYVTPISIGAAHRRTGSQKTSALRKAAQDAKQDDHSVGFTQQSPRIPKKVTLVKNGDITAQRPIILNRRNARSLKALLDEISDIMQFTVKKLFTLDGKKIDSMQALLHCPNVLVCVGREPFKPMVKENPRKHSSEKLPGLTSRSSSNNNGENQEMNFGLEAKKSVMHPRSSLSNRSQRFSLSSEKSSTNGLTTSPENGAPFPRNCPHSKAGEPTHSLINDDIEKKVHVNKDGSLSVEMKVRFRLLNDETLHWSTQLKKSMNKIPGEELSVSNDNGLELTENPEASSELDDASLLYPCDIDSYMSNVDESELDEVRCRNCGKLCKDYDIWKNPMHISQKEEPGVKSTWYTHSSCSSTSSHRRIVRKKVASVDSIRTSSSGEEYSKHVVRESSHYSETVENMVEYRTVKNCCCQGGCGESNTSQRGTPEAMDGIANSVNQQNEEDAAEGQENINTGGRPGSNRSKSSQGSAESQIRICDKSSSLARTISSGSIKERGELEDVVACSSPPNSIYSKSGKGSVLDGAQENVDEVSENDHPVSSVSMDSCARKDAAEDEAEKEDEEINEIYSVSENPGSNPSVKDDASECGRSSTARSIRSESSAGNHRRKNSNEVHLCSAASASSRTSKKSKPSQNHLEVASNRSVASSRGSTSSKKKKKPNSSFQAEDSRSNSRASHYSRSSHEVEKRDSGHASQDSSRPHSHGSSLSEAAAPPAYNEGSTSSLSRCYSKSSRNSQKENQIEGSIKVPSHCSSFSDCGGENGDGIPKIGSPEGSSPKGDVSESTCSKCGHITKPCRDDLRSTSSKVSSHSEGRSRCAETEASRRSDDACSQSSIAMSSKPRRKKANSLHADIEGSSQVSASESMYSLRYPSPPKGRPSSRKSRTLLLKKSSKGTSACTESELIADKEEKEATASQPPEALNAEEGSCQVKLQEEAEMETSASCGGDQIIPSSLPNASLEEVVHEWLRKIPSETLLMKCEMQDDGEGAELDAEITGCSTSQELLEGDSEEKKEDTKEVESTADAVEPMAEGAEEEAVNEEPKEDLSEEKVSETVVEEMEAEEAMCNLSALTSQKNHKKDLPSNVQTSVQIMKALLASKQEAKMDRAHSLPEVSPTMGRKLSNSANILITCLASLQFLDEELDPSNKSSKGLNRPRYTELLNIFQALWCTGHTSEKGGPSNGIGEESPAKVSAGYKGHCSKDGDFTPMSSSGVDVSSGDGGSGEGSVAGGQDHALSEEKTEEAKPAEEDVENTELEVRNEDDKEGGDEEVECVGGEEAAETTEDCEIEQAGEKEIAEEGAMEESDQQENENVECGEVNADGDTIQVEAEEKAVEEPGQQEDENVEGGEADADGDTVQVEAEEEAVEETGQQEDENVEGVEADADGDTVQVEAEEETVEETGQQEDENVEGGEVGVDGDTVQVEAEEETVEETSQQEDENVEGVEAAADEETVQVEAKEETVEEISQQEDENVEGVEAAADEETVQVEAEEEAVEETSQQKDENVVDGEADADGETAQVESEEEAMEENVQQEDENVEGGEVDADGETVQVETQEDSLVKEAEDSPSQENVDQVTEEPSNHELIEEPGHNDPSTKEGNEQEEPEIGGEKQSEADAQPSSQIIPLQTPVKVSPIVQQKSIDPDPIWVLKLLKKIEKEFMTHYVNAMNEFKVKWNLPNTDEVNVMISELKEEVNRRIQKSIEKELKKIRSRAGRMVPRPPDELQRESTLQVENRRRRLQSIRKMSLYNDQNANQSNPQETFSYEMGEDFIFSTIRDDDSELPSEEEYCPCDACIRKKIEARALRGPVVLPVAANAPVVKAFDLHQILKMKKGSIPEKMVENSIPEEDQGEEAEGKTDEPEVGQETEPDEGKEAGETDEKEEEEQEVNEDEAEVLPDETLENQNCEEVEGGEATNEEAEEETKEVGEEDGDEGKEGEVAGEEEKKEGDEKEEETEDVKEEEEEVDAKVEEEEEPVKEENEGKEVEEGDVIEEEEKEEVSVKEEEEAKGEELELEEEKEEKEAETEEVEAGEEMEKSVKEEEEEKVEMEEEKEEESVKEEGEGDAEEETEGGVDEEQGGGEVAPDEAKEEKEEKSVKEGEEEVEQEKEGGEEGEDGGDDVTLDEMEEEKEEIEGGKEGEEEEEAEEGGEEVAGEDNNQEEEEDKNEEEEKDIDEEQKEDEETEEEPKVEDEADGAAVEPEAREGESQKDPTEDAENADDAGGLEEEAAEKETEIEEDTEGGGGAEVVEEEDAKPEEDCEACSITAAVEEGENKEGEDEAGEKEEEAEGEDGNVPEQTDGDEVDPATAAEEEEAEDCEEPSEAVKNLRKASAISSMGNCSQQSQKGSEDGSDGEDCKEEGEINKDEEAGSNPEKKPGAMYADIEEEEEEEDEEDRASSPGSGGKAEEPKTDEKEENNSQGSKKKSENTEVIDQDDLDF